MEVLETGDKALSSHKRRTMVKHWQFCAVRSFARDANCIQAHNQLIPRSPHSIVPHLAMGLYNIALELDYTFDSSGLGCTTFPAVAKVRKAVWPRIMENGRATQCLVVGASMGTSISSCGVVG